MQAGRRQVQAIAAMIAVVFLGGGGETLQVGADAQGAQDAPQVEGCLFSPDSLLGVDPLTAETVTEPPAHMIAAAPQTLAYRATIVFEGPCAPMLEAFGFGLGRLSNGEWFQIEGAGFVAGRVGPPPAFLKQVEEPPAGAPAIANAPPTYLVPARSASEGAAQSAYIGVWTDGTRWSVAHVLEPTPGQFSAPTVLLTSATPLRSVSFVPMLQDGNAVLSIVEEADGKIRVHQYRWRS